MAKQIKKRKLLFIIFIFLIIIGIAYKTEINEITARIIGPKIEIVTEQDIKLYELALETNDESICSQIDFNDFKQDCFVKIAESKQEISICENIEEQKVKYSCYTELSKLLNDVELCKLVEDIEYWNDICYKNYAIANNNSDYCWFIPKGINNNPCFYEVAVNTLDWESCRFITDESKLNKCNNVISQKLLIIEPCYEMGNIIDRDACIIRLAKKSNNAEYCNEIKLDTIKKDCTDAFSE